MIRNLENKDIYIPMAQTFYDENVILILITYTT